MLSKTLFFPFFRKSLSSKMIERVNAEVIGNGIPPANQRQIENAHRLLPVMGNHAVDIKVKL